MFCLELRRKQPAHRDIGDRRHPLCFRRRRHVAKSLAPVFGKRRATIGENEPRCDVGMADGHLQRYEPAIAVAEHDGLGAGALFHGFRHPVGDFSEAAADGLGFSKTRQFRNDQAERLRQVWRDGIKTRPIRQQRMKQEERRPLLA